MEGGFDTPREVTPQIETPDGNGVFLFRYDNPQKFNNHQDSSSVTKPELVGRWFTDSPRALGTYIRARGPGGKVLALEVSKTKLAEMRAANHSEAKGMDIEGDNYIVPEELLSDAQSFPLEVDSDNPDKFLFKHFVPIRNCVAEIVKQLQKEGVEADD